MFGVGSAKLEAHTSAHELAIENEGSAQLFNLGFQQLDRGFIRIVDTNLWRLRDGGRIIP